MFTPQASTTVSSSSRHSRHLTAYERILAVAVTTALAAVAALALLMPSTSAPAATESAGTPTVSNGQIARGKATLPASASPAQVVQAPID